MVVRGFQTRISSIAYLLLGPGSGPPNQAAASGNSAESIVILGTFVLYLCEEPLNLTCCGSTN